MTSVKDKNQIIKEDNKDKLRTLEQFYVDGTVDDILPALTKRKEELVSKMIEYAKENEEACKWDKDGDPIDYHIVMKPVVINNYFFKSIVPLGSKIPLYNAEKLSLGFDYYMDLITEVNNHIGNFPPSLTGFCKLMGISMQTLREYRSSNDIDMRNICEKIYDQIGEDNLTMSQIGVARERSTLFRLKAQNEMVEKVQPNVNITYKEVVNVDNINEKMEKYKKLIDKKVK